MKYLKKYKDFFEDGVACADAGVAGMGAVVSAQVGDLPGVAGSSGSGDVTFTFKKEKRKKGNPSQVTDLRDLADVKTNKVKDIKEALLTQEENDILHESLIELYDMGFVIESCRLDKDSDEYDVDDDTSGKFNSGELRIDLTRELKIIWTGNLNIRCHFNKNEIYKTNIGTLRGSGSNLSKKEQELLTTVDDVSHRLINTLEYTSGIFTIEYFARPGLIDVDRNVTNVVSIVLHRINYPTNESYSKQEYIEEIRDKLEQKNIRPVVLNRLLHFYDSEITKKWEDGQAPQLFVDEIVNDLELDSGGFLSYKIGSSAWWKGTNLKYL